MSISGGSGRQAFVVDPPEREADVLRNTLGIVRSSLPAAWSFRVEEEAPAGDINFDAVVTIGAPDRGTAHLVVEAKRLVAVRDVAVVLEDLRARIGRAGLGSASPMVIARYLPPSVRERLESEGVAYADATGNVRVELSRPALFLRTTGEDHDPWRGPGRPRGTLKGAPAARVVRALADFSPPYSVPDLVERAGASTGATYRVVKFLEEEALLEREPRGLITEVRWRRLIERWSQDHGFLRSDVVRSFLFPRGIERLVETLRAISDVPSVVTGTLAAERFASYAPARVGMIYTDDVALLAERLEMRPAERGSNVLLGANRDEVAFLRAQELDGVLMAAPSQVAVDLLAGPGRSPSEGQFLLDWMEAHEPAWRS